MSDAREAYLDTLRKNPLKDLIVAVRVHLAGNNTPEQLREIVERIETQTTTTQHENPHTPPPPVDSDCDPAR